MTGANSFAQVESWNGANNVGYSTEYKPDHWVQIGLYGQYYNHIPVTTSKAFSISGKAKINFTLKNITEFNNHYYMGYVMHVYVKNSKGNTIATKHYGFRQDSRGDNNGRFYKLTKPSSSASYYLYDKSEIVTGQYISDEITFDNSEAGYYLYAETEPAYSETEDAAYGYTSYSGRTGTDGVRFGCDYQINANSDNHGAILTVLTSQTVRYDIYDDKPLWTATGEGTDVDATPILSNRMSTVDHSSNAIDVYVHRKLTKGSWTTLCLPFAVTVENLKTDDALGTDCIISEFKDVDLKLNRVNFLTIKDDVKSLKAGYPYLVYYNGDDKDYFKATGVTFDYTKTDKQTELTKLDKRKSEKKNDGYYYTALLEPTQAGAATESLGDGCMVYVASPDASGTQYLKKLKDGGSIKGFRAYLYYPSSGVSSAAKGTNFICIDDFADGGTTGMTTVTVDGKAVGGDIYNLQGINMGADASHLKAGIYVRNGKKFVVR